MKKFAYLFLMLMLIFSCNKNKYINISNNLEFCVKEIKCSYNCNDDTISKYPLCIVEQKQLLEGQICSCVKINSRKINDFNHEIAKNEILRIWLYDKDCIFFEIESQNNLFKEKNCFVSYVENFSRLKYIDFVPQNISQIRSNWYYLERQVSY